MSAVEIVAACSSSAQRLPDAKQRRSHYASASDTAAVSPSCLETKYEYQRTGNHSHHFVLFRNAIKHDSTLVAYYATIHPAGHAPVLVRQLTQVRIQRVYSKNTAAYQLQLDSGATNSFDQLTHCDNTGKMKHSTTDHATLAFRYVSARYRSVKLACLLSAIFLVACGSSGDEPASTATGTTTTSNGNTAGNTTGSSTEGTTDGTTASNTSSGTADSTSGSTSNGLGPLPTPPLTAAPSPDNEPVAEANNLHTVTNFQVVRDTGPRLPFSIEPKLTDADFDAGPLAPVISVPDDVDPDTNAAPRFDNLSDIEAVAGEQLAIVFKPVDSDGDVPGMFPEELPPGASFDDNFDGSKTYRWQPLQMDVGINEFTVTAIDSQNDQYRTRRTIRIRVRLPDDPSTIPNVAPTLDEYVPHTVRQNDPVVMELKGIDLNGDVPTLELVSDLPGASFVQNARYEELYTLRFVPNTPGTMNIQVRARDSIDTSLSEIGTVTIEVLPSSEFERSGKRLRELATARGINIGYASLPFYYHRPDGGIYAATAASEFNLVTPENAMKMDTVNPLPGRYEFADIDNLISFAQLNNIDVHGHPGIWYRQLPDWILNAEPSTLRGHMREHIDRLMSRYKNDIALWDVVNEPIADNGGFRESIWYKSMGESYLDIAFKQARQTAPNATLLLNDFDIAFNGPKADTLFTMLDGLKERNVPIDGVGFQLHVFSSFDQFDEVRANFAKVAERDLDIYITELDVALTNGDSLQVQANVYQSIVELCLEQVRCKAIQTWGFTDQYSFREIFNPLLFDKRYQPKPAYTAIQNALEN